MIGLITYQALLFATRVKTSILDAPLADLTSMVNKIANNLRIPHFPVDLEATRISVLGKNALI